MNWVFAGVTATAVVLAFWAGRLSQAYKFFKMVAILREEVAHDFPQLSAVAVLSTILSFQQTDYSPKRS